MPNEVFLRTREGLSTMVSTRAASRILEGALKGSGHDPDEVSQSQMRSALLGPVLHELESVLPRAGLKRNLERLAKSLRETNAEKETPMALLTGSIPPDLVPVNGVGSRVDDVAGGAADPSGGAVEADHGAAAAVEAAEEPMVAAAEEPMVEPTMEATVEAGAEPAADHEMSSATDPALAPSEAVDGDVDAAVSDPLWRAPEGPFEAFPAQRPRPEGGPVAGTAGARKVTPRLLRRLGDDELEEIVTRFALIDHVRLVAGVRVDGSVPVSRGDGIDLELLSRLSRLSLSLLGKGGELRSLHLGHSHGQLFLFPIGPDLLIVFGAADLNLGSVTTAFTALALEEDL